MSGLPSVSRIQNYVPGNKHVRQGGGWDKPEKSSSSSSKVLSRSKILLRMWVPVTRMAILLVKEKKN